MIPSSSAPRAMGRLMDKIMAFVPLGRSNSVTRVRDELRLVAPICCWTEGTWEELNMPWNALQNVPRHINALSNLLIRAYVQSRTPSFRAVANG